MTHRAPIALLIAVLPVSLAAEPWDKVDELPGAIAIELDRDSVFETLDGTRLVLRGTFRRDMPMGTMQTSVAVDCERELAKIRGVRLLDGDRVLTERSDPLADFAPVSPGSAEAIYFRALCGRDAASAALPPPAEEAVDGKDRE